MTDEVNEVSEATSSEEEVVLEETTDIEDVEAIKVKLAEAEEAKRQLTARAHKAEAENKTLKSKSAEASQVNSNALSADDVDAKILQSQGMSEDLITELKVLAKVRNTSILATQLDPIFVAIKEKKEAEEKNAKASLGASKGSGQVKAKKTASTPNLSPEEHKELWLKEQRQ